MNNEVSYTIMWKLSPNDSYIREQISYSGDAERRFKEICNSTNIYVIHGIENHKIYSRIKQTIVFSKYYQL